MPCMTSYGAAGCLQRIHACMLSRPQVGKLGLAAPIYATHPVIKMGEMFMYDAWLAHHGASEFETWDLDDVDAAFGAIAPLKFQQTAFLTGGRHQLIQPPRRGT